MGVWQSFWFSPSGPRLLGVGRALVCAALWLDVAFTRRALWADLPEIFYTPAFPLQYLGTPSYALSSALEGVWKLALFCSALGLFTRFSVAVSALLGMFVLSLPYNYCGFGYAGNHHYHALELILWILAFSRCGDSFSLDALLWKRKVLPSAHYTWPVRLIWVALSSVFFLAALTKLRVSGLDWVSSDNLSGLLVRRHYFESSTPLVDWGLALSQNALGCQAFALACLLCELAYPLGMLMGLPAWSRWRWPLIFPLAMLVNLLAFRLLVGPNFWLVAVAHVFWWPPELVDQPPQPQGQSRLAVLLLILLTGSGYAWAFRRELFPFSWYPMYSTVNRDQELSRYVLFGVGADGGEWPLQWERSEPTGDPTLHRILMHRTFRHYGEQPQKLQQCLEDCLRRYRRLGSSLQGIRLYECHWTLHPGLEGRDSPRKVLVLEVSGSIARMGGNR